MLNVLVRALRVSRLGSFRIPAFALSAFESVFLCVLRPFLARASLDTPWTVWVRFAFSLSRFPLLNLCFFVFFTTLCDWRAPPRSIQASPGPGRDVLRPPPPRHPPSQMSVLYAPGQYKTSPNHVRCRRDISRHFRCRGDI